MLIHYPAGFLEQCALPVTCLNVLVIELATQINKMYTTDCVDGSPHNGTRCRY